MSDKPLARTEKPNWDNGSFDDIEANLEEVGRGSKALSQLVVKVVAIFHNHPHAAFLWTLIAIFGLSRAGMELNLLYAILGAGFLLALSRKSP